MKESTAAIRQSRVKREIFKISIGYSFVVVAALGICFAMIFYSLQMDKAYAVLQHKNSAVALFMQGFFGEIHSMISILEDSTEVRLADRLGSQMHKRILDAYRSFAKANTNIMYVYSGYESGLMLINDYVPPDNYVPKERPWYEAAVAAGRDLSIGLPYQDINTGEWLLSTSKALFDERGKLQGVAAIDCSVQEIAHLLTRHDGDESSYSYVVDKQGAIILHHHQPYLKLVVPEVLDAIRQSPNGRFEYVLEGKRKIAYFSQIDSKDWFAVSIVNKSEIAWPILWRSLLISGLALIFASILGLVQSAFLSRYFIEPLAALRRRVHAIIAGDKAGEGDAEAYVYPDNEIGEIAQEIGQLTRDELYRKNQNLVEAEAALQSEVDQQAVLLRETHHRIKNNIASIASMLSLQASRTENTEAAEALEDAIGRVHSMKELYEKMTVQAAYRDIDASEYILDLIDSIALFFSGSITLHISKDIDSIVLNAKKLFPLGIIINELLTNAAKYAFPGLASGNISVSMKQQGAVIRLTVQDSGGGLPEGFNLSVSSGFGLMLVEILCRQIGATLALEQSNGTRIEIMFNV